MTKDIQVDVASEMLSDAIKILDKDPEMAATIFTRWLTMNSENTLKQLPISQSEFHTLTKTLIPHMKSEFQTQALSIYMYCYNTVDEVLESNEYSEDCVLNASSALASFLNYDRNAETL
jgi:hypothetical protein